MRKRSEYFARTWQNLLLAPPAGMIGILAVDPGIRTGCKIAVVDETGKFVDHSVIYPLEPRNDFAGRRATSRADPETQRTRDRDRQRHRVARDIGIRPGVLARKQLSRSSA